MSKADLEKLKDISKRIEDSGLDYSENTLRNLFTEAGLNSKLIEKAIKDYQRYREKDFSDLSMLTAKEIRDIGAEALSEKVQGMIRGSEIVHDILLKYVRYLNYKDEIVKAYQESKDWGKVFSTYVYSDVNEAQESFIDYIEEINNTKVKNVKHLQELTGITHLDSWDEVEGGYKVEETKGKVSKENALRELEHTLTGSRYSKYFRALETTLQKGGKYKDLLDIKLEDYELPETWSGCLGKDKYSSLLWAVSFEFMINEPVGIMLLPSLRNIAEEIEAPYSVIMDAYELTNKGRGVSGIKAKLKKLERELKADVLKYIEKQPKKWKADRVMIEAEDWDSEKVEQIKTDYAKAFITWFNTLVLNEVRPDIVKEDIGTEIREVIYKEFKTYLERAKLIYSGK